MAQHQAAADRDRSPRLLSLTFGESIKEKYMQILVQPFAEKSMGDFIEQALSGVYGDFDSFRVSVAFAKRSRRL